MNIRHVEFPCGRCGLELETEFRGDEWTGLSYAYFYNNFDYRNIAINENVELKFNHWGRIEGLTVLAENIDIREMLREASRNWV